MEWIDNFNAAIEELEKHITEEADCERLARIACCSSFHFQRMFTYIVGIPLSEYIRRRRMSLAAVDLQNGGKVADVAVQYGYDSPTAFNRAFQKVHGLAPSQVQAGGAAVKAFPPVRFTLSVTGGAPLSYRVEEKPAFRIVGLSAPMSEEIEENFGVVPGLWQKAAETGAVEKLAGMMNREPMGILGVSAEACDGTWKYFIAAASDLPAEPPFDTCQIPAATWAIFSGEGPMPTAIQTLERRAVTEWLPTSGYEYANAPDIELYLTPNPANATFEVWLPVRKVEK